MQTETADQVFNFSGFTLDLGKGLLHRNAVPISLRPKAHAVLTHLACNLGRVVPKSELMDAVWPGIYVTEDSLTQSIREIRKALGDEKQELVRNISRRGYMLAAAMEPMPEVGSQPIVAVLRFRNETGDATHVPLIDGFAEDIINGLTRFGTIMVLARHSSFSMLSESKADWSLVRSRIGADYLVEGAVVRYGKRLRVSVSLVDAISLVQLWGDRYDVEEADIFSVQEQIVSQIIGRLVTKLDDAGIARSSQKPVANLAAYELTLRGVALLRGNDPDDIKTAQGLLESAVAKDPDFSFALAQLAMCQIMIGGYGWASKDVLGVALSLAKKATTLSPELPAGHRVLSFAQMYLRDYAAAENSLRKSLELNPNDCESVEQMGYLLTLRGRPLDALAWIDKAIRLNPIHPPWYDYDRSLAHYSLADYRAATQAIERTTIIPPWIRTRLAACYAQLGDMALAQFHAGKINETDPDFSPVIYAKRGVAFEHAADNQHFAEGVFRALGLLPEV